MDKLLEVKEFDLITGNADFQDDEKYAYLEEPVFSELIQFIHEFSVSEGDSDVLDFFKISYKRNVGDVVTVKNYVGLIQMKNGYQIEILPKIEIADEDKENLQTKKVFIQMLRSMKDFPCKVFNDAGLKVEKMNIYEIFINMYLQEVRHLLKKGIKSSYVNQEDNLKYYKGKLLTSQHIKNNIAHKERFYVSYDEFLPDIAENRIVKATLLKLQNLSSSYENSKEINQLLNAFEMVTPSTNYDKDFSQIRIDRNTKDYEMLIRWSKVFLFNKSFSSFSGNCSSRALLFPMEKVFENYVAINMRKVMSPFGWEVYSQDYGKWLFDTPDRKFALRPDIVCSRKNGNSIQKVIMDTKWKKLVNDKRCNYGISQADMYQMYAYSKKYCVSEIFLLYPVTEEFRDHCDIKFISNDRLNFGNDNVDSQTIVNVYFVDLQNIESSIETLLDKFSLR